MSVGGVEGYCCGFLSRLFAQAPDVRVNWRMYLGDGGLGRFMWQDLRCSFSSRDVCFACNALSFSLQLPSPLPLP